MNKKIIISALGLALVAWVLFKLVDNKHITESKVYQYDKSKAIMVQVDTIHIQPFESQNSYTGTFEPNKESKISAESQGKINAIWVDVGSVVTKGQTLIQLDRSLLQLQLQAIEVQIEGLTDDVKRYTILTQADAIQGVQLEKAQLGLKSAKIQKETLLEQIQKTTIKAPFSGIVTAKFNEEGGFAAPGVPLLQITDISILKFTIHIPEHDLQYFQLGKPCTLTIDTQPGIKLNGKVNMIASKANLGNSFDIQIQVENTRDLAIKSGMFGKVQINETGVSKGILIPSSAILEKENQPQVYVVKNGKAILQTIVTAQNIGNQTRIQEGLQEGDQVVTQGFVNLFENANVSIQPDKDKNQKK